MCWSNVIKCTECVHCFIRILNTYLFPKSMGLKSGRQRLYLIFKTLHFGISAFNHSNREFKLIELQSVTSPFQTVSNHFQFQYKMTLFVRGRSNRKMYFYTQGSLLHSDMNNFFCIFIQFLKCIFNFAPMNLNPSVQSVATYSVCLKLNIACKCKCIMLHLQWSV